MSEIDETAKEARRVTKIVDSTIGTQSYEVPGFASDDVETIQVSYLTADLGGVSDAPLELDDVTVAVTAREGGIDVEVESEQLPAGLVLKVILILK